MHRSHQDPVFQCRESKIKWLEQMWVLHFGHAWWIEVYFAISEFTPSMENILANFR